MTRFNYLGAANAAAAARGFTFAIDNRIRGPLAVLVASVILTVALTCVQVARLHAAQRAYAVTADRLHTSEVVVEALRALRTRVEQKSHVALQIDAARRESLLHANELAWIGNHLPADMWLSVLRYENGGYALEGTSAHVNAVGTALLALHADGFAATPRLVSLRDDTGGGGAAPIHYVLRLDPRP